jgi:hypothetical protein
MLDTFNINPEFTSFQFLFDDIHKERLICRLKGMARETCSLMRSWSVFLLHQIEKHEIATLLCTASPLKIILDHYENFTKLQTICTPPICHPDKPMKVQWTTTKTKLTN